jgi:hypothetical protein
MKKLIVIIIVIALLIPITALPVYAAPVMAIEVPDLFGVIGDALSNIWDNLGGFFQPIIDSISSGLAVIGSFFADIGRAITNAVKALLNGIYNLFVPREDMLESLTGEIQKRFTQKFSAILGLSTYLKNRFSNIGVANTTNLFTINLPATQISQGYSINLLRYISQYLPIIRAAFTSFISLLTVAFCYKKVKEVVNV